MVVCLPYFLDFDALPIDFVLDKYRPTGTSLRFVYATGWQESQDVGLYLWANQIWEQRVENNWWMHRGHVHMAGPPCARAPSARPKSTPMHIIMGPIDWMAYMDPENLKVRRDAHHFVMVLSLSVMDWVEIISPCSHCMLWSREQLFQHSHDHQVFSSSRISGGAA